MLKTRAQKDWCFMRGERERERERETMLILFLMCSQPSSLFWHVSQLRSLPGGFPSQFSTPQGRKKMLINFLVSFFNWLGNLTRKIPYTCNCKKKKQKTLLISYPQACLLKLGLNPKEKMIHSCSLLYLQVWKLPPNMKASVKILLWRDSDFREEERLLELITGSLNW